MTKVGERLQEALNRKGWSAYKLSEAMKARGFQRCSHPTIRRYLLGETQPQQEFIHGAARILEVRPEWLLGDTGGPLVGGHEVTATALYEMACGPDEDDESRLDFDRVLRRKFQEYGDLTPLVSILFGNTYARLVKYKAAQREDALGATERAECAGDLGGRLLNDWHKFRGTPNRTEWESVFASREFTDYAVARLHAMMLAMPAR